ncbi:hypothetical protein A9K97_gp364 [Tokyovirus A1]|uniref:hypothetical protein n=1 Tax=Tokyovirus A1 TaxID=1826170 RepID=UPI0007A98BE8|nr:hypothetical protein A9K97_gp364 [Tokyovirus A1]BAU79987.1 hypothetical protein [Tokyovirus A1]
MSSRCANKLQSKGLTGAPEEQIRKYFQAETNVFEYARVLACLSGRIQEETFSEFEKLLSRKRESYCSLFVAEKLRVSDTKNKVAVRSAFAEWHRDKKDQRDTVKLKQCLVDIGIFKTPYKLEQFLRQTGSDTCSRYLEETGILEADIPPSKDYVLPRLFLWHTRFSNDERAVSRVATCLVVLGIFKDKKEVQEKLKSFSEVYSTVRSCSSFLGTLGLWPAPGRVYLEENEALTTRSKVLEFLRASKDEILSKKVRECATLTGILGEEEDISISGKEVLVLSPKVVDAIREPASDKKRQCRDFFSDIGIFPKEAEFIHPSQISLYGPSLQYAYKEANILQKLRILECSEALGIFSREKISKKEAQLEKCLVRLRQKGFSSVSADDMISPAELRELEMKVRKGVWDQETAECVGKVLGSGEKPKVKEGALVVRREKEKFEKILEELDSNIARSDVMAYCLMVLKVLDIAPNSLLVPEVLEFVDDLSSRVDLWFEETQSPVLKHEVLVAAGSLGILNKPKYERLADQLVQDSLDFLERKGISKNNLDQVFSGAGTKSFGILRIASMAGILSDAEIQRYLVALRPQRQVCISGLKKAAFLPFVPDSDVELFMPLAAHKFMVWAEKEFEASALDGTEFLNMASCITLVNSEEQGSLVFEVPSWSTIKKVQKETVDNIPSGLLTLEKEGIISQDVDTTDISKVAESINQRFELEFEKKSPEKKLMILSAVASTGIAESASLQDLRKETLQEQEQEKPFMVTASPPKKLPSGVSCTKGANGRYYWFLNGKRTRAKKEWDRELCQKKAFMKTSKRPKRLPKDVMCIEGKDGKFYWLKKGRLTFSGTDRPCP